MNKKMTYIYDHATGIEEVREATEEELDLIAQGAKDKAEREAWQAQELANKESGKAKLLALGLTQDEVNALLGKEPEPFNR